MTRRPTPSSLRTSFLAVLALAIAALLPLAAAPARADDCAGRTVEVVNPPGATWSIELRWVEGTRSWQRRTVGVGMPDDWRPMPHLGAHAHLVVVTAKTAPFFAVIDTSAEHQSERRVLVQTSLDGVAPAMFRALGFDTLLTPAEALLVTRSISHTHWLFADPPPWSYGADGDTLRLKVISGREVAIPLVPGK